MVEDYYSRDVRAGRMMQNVMRMRNKDNGEIWSCQLEW